MDDRNVVLILFNMQLGLDYADAKPYGKMEVDMLEADIAMLRKEDSPLFLCQKIKAYYGMYNIKKRGIEYGGIRTEGTQQKSGR